MARVLFLVHRLPYPPNKGDKVRSFHMLRHLAVNHDVHLGTFIDDPADEVHLPKVKSFCATMHAARLVPRTAKLRSAIGLVTGEALSLPYYRDSSLREWVAATIKQVKPDVAVVFSSVMADYLNTVPGLPALVDFVDMDSAKWTQYAQTHGWPMSWVYRREGAKLFAFERLVAKRSHASFFVTDAEAAMFRAAAPESAEQVGVICNGVDADFFSPANAGKSPFTTAEVPLVFTGAMDYWPNVDAATWFATEAMPMLQQAVPGAKFYIVGRSPDPSLRVLADGSGGRVVVTGTVDDVRPYLAHAKLVVAPLRIARGIQNKVLEAMAMARPVIASANCAGPIQAEPGKHLMAAASIGDYVDAITTLLADTEAAEAMGRVAREHVVAHYSWDAHLAGLDRAISRVTS